MDIADRNEIIRLMKLELLLVGLGQDGFLNYYSGELECIFAMNLVHPMDHLRILDNCVIVAGGNLI
jgi:hypothetical protein